MADKDEEEERRGGAVPLLVRGAGPARAGRLWADLERVFGIRISSPWAQSLGELGAALKSPGVLAALGLSAGLGIALLYNGSAPALPGPGFAGFGAAPVAAPEASGLPGDGINMFRGANSLPMPEAAPAVTADAAAPDAALKDAAAKAAAESAKESSPGTAAEGSAVPGATPQDAPALAPRLGPEANPRLVMGASLSGPGGNVRSSLASAKAAPAAGGSKAEAGGTYGARPTDSRTARSLSTARGRSRQGPTGKNAFGQLRFADNRSRLAAAGAGETSRYQAAEAFDGKSTGGGIGGTGLSGPADGTGSLGVTASPSPDEPIRSVTPRQQPAPIANGKNKTTYQQQMRLAIALLALSALAVAIAAMLRMAADKNPLQAPLLLAYAQVAAAVGAALGAGAGAIGMWLMNQMGQNAQGTMILAAGAALTALGAKVAIDSGQAASALADGGPLTAAESAAGASAAQNIPPSFATGVVDPAVTTAP